MLRATSISASWRSMRQHAQHDPVRARRAVHGEHRAVGALGGAAKRSASPKTPVWSTSVPKKPAEIEHVGGVEVLDPLLVGEDRRRAPAVVAAHVLVEDAHDRRASVIGSMIGIIPLRGPLARAPPAPRPAALRGLHLGRAPARGHRLQLEERALVFERELRKDKMSGWRWFLGAWGVGPTARTTRVDIATSLRGPAEGGRGPRDPAARTEGLASEPHHRVRLPAYPRSFGRG